MTKAFILIILLLPATLLAQPMSYTSAQIERVAKLSELYGHIKFFHPYLGYKPINWDSAFAVAAPLVANAKTDTETIVAVRQLLSVLGDEATTVGRVTKSITSTPPSGATTSADTLRVYWAADSVLVFQTNGYAEVNEGKRIEAKLNIFTNQLPRARAVLLDLRSPRFFSERETYNLQYDLNSLKLEQSFATGSIHTGGMRLRQHSGFAPETGWTSGGYWSGFYLLGGKTLPAGQKAGSRPLAVLLNKNSVLPPTLLALRPYPHVRFYSTEPMSDGAMARTVSFPFSDSVAVRFRTGEALNADGSLVAAMPTLPATTKPEAVTSYVLDQLRAYPTQTGAIETGTLSAPLPIAPPSPVYPADKYPTLGYRLLAGAKIWSIIHYFFAYKDLMPTDWNANLRTAIGELAAASDSTAYNLAVFRFYRNLQDSHGYISSSVMEHYWGMGGIPAEIRFLAKKPVITRIWGDADATKGMSVGDVITAINGEAVDARMARIMAVLNGSNEWSRLYESSLRLLRGSVGGAIQVDLLGTDGRPKTTTLSARPTDKVMPPRDTTDLFRVLPGNIGYVNLMRLRTKDVDRMFDSLRTTKAIIFDMRGYPNGTAWSIAPRLTDKRNVVGAKFFRYAPNEPDFPHSGLSNSTQKYTFDDLIPGNTGQSVYRGKTVMLMDERTGSQAEGTGLFFEAANGTEFIGSPTAGVNGDITDFSVPGGIILNFSGHHVRHADGRQLQQVGLQPKILVQPTINGIRAGKDEVLERAVQYLSTGK